MSENQEKINTLTINDVEYVRKDSIHVPEGDYYPYNIGEDYFIQTVTHYFLGTLVAVTGLELIINNASWVASTGRFSEFMSGQDPSENEPFNKDQLVIVGRGAVVSAVNREVALELL